MQSVALFGLLVCVCNVSCFESGLLQLERKQTVICSWPLGLSWLNKPSVVSSLLLRVMVLIGTECQVSSHACPRSKTCNLFILFSPVLTFQPLPWPPRQSRVPIWTYIGTNYISIPFAAAAATAIVGILLVSISSPKRHLLRAGSGPSPLRCCPDRIAGGTDTPR